MTEKKDKFNFKFLPDYAAFLLKEKIRDFVKEGLILSREEDMPILKYFTTFSDEQLIEMAMKANEELLSALAGNKAREYAEKALAKWNSNDIEVIEKGDLVAEDITLVAFIRTKLLRKFLPFYTEDFDLYNNILEDIDRFITQTSAIGFNAYLNFQQQKIKSINATLSNREEQLLEAQEIAQLGSFSWDLTDSKNSYYSPETLKIFGLEKSTDFTSFLEYVHPDDKELIKSAVSNALSNGLYENEYRYVKKDHEKRIWSRGIVQYTDGKPVRIKGTVMNVTKNHQLVEDLEEKKENLKQLIENAPDAIIVIDKNGVVHLWNPKAETIFGWKAEEIVGKSLADKIIPEATRESYKKGMQRLLFTGTSTILNHTLELSAINKTGEELYTSITISQTMQAGEIAFIAFLRDISAEKKNQIELRKKTLQLLELNNSLAVKNAELESINKELESFNYVASHDLQEPLRKIQIYSNRLIEKDITVLPKHTLEYINKIQTSSTWMQRLIEDLLSFSQLTSISEAFQNVDLNALLEEVKNTLAQSIEEKNVIIESEHLPEVNVIPFQFSQLFINIIGNAIRYGKENNAPHIRISSKTVNTKDVFINEFATAGKYLQLTISDNGIGFEPEYAEKIFDLFKRLHTKGKYTGTGIGLSICKKIVHNHNGFIKAESKNEEGATFHIYIPASRIN